MLQIDLTSALAKKECLIHGSIFVPRNPQSDINKAMNNNFLPKEQIIPRLKALNPLDIMATAFDALEKWNDSDTRYMRFVVKQNGGLPPESLNKEYVMSLAPLRDSYPVRDVYTKEVADNQQSQIEFQCEELGALRGPTLFTGISVKKPGENVPRKYILLVHYFAPEAKCFESKQELLDMIGERDSWLRA